jgi:hypothetical protein
MFYGTSSDARLKGNIVETHYGLSDLMKIGVEDFTWNSDGSPDNGFIAQDLYKIYPNAVVKGDNGTDPYIPGVTNIWEVDYGRITPLIVKAVQDMNLNLEGIAGTVIPVPGSDSDTFVTAFFKNIEAKIGAWLADTTNGIANIFAQTITVNNANVQNLCVSDASGAKTCITKSQLDSLLSNVGSVQSSVLNNPTPTPSTETTTPAPTPTSDTSSTPTPTDSGTTPTTSPTTAPTTDGTPSTSSTSSEGTNASQGNSGNSGSSTTSDSTTSSSSANTSSSDTTSTQ